MTELRGKGISAGIVFGRIYIVKHKKIDVERTLSDDPAAEEERFACAVKKTLAQLDVICEKARMAVGEEDAQIFEIHKMMLEDPDYVESVEKYISDSRFTAEYAVSLTSAVFDEIFAAVEDDYMRSRSADVRDVSRRLIMNLMGIEENELRPEKGSVIFADDLAPSEMLSIGRSGAAAICTSEGSANSHTAILARNMSIPAVIGIDGVYDESAEGMNVIIDGSSGVVYIDPNEQAELEMLRRQTIEAEENRLIEELKDRETVTKDGCRVRIFGCIDSAEQCAAAVERGAEGVGLFRSDILFGGSTASEEEQFRCYRDIIEKMQGRQTIIRVSDIGSQMNITYRETAGGSKMGFRAEEAELVHPEMLKAQMRALFRASVYGKLGVLFPLIVSLEEMDTIKRIIYDVGDELRREGIRVRDNIQIGAAVENPAAAFMSDVIAGEADFFFADLDKLALKTLSADRSCSIRNIPDTHHPAVLRMIKLAADNAHRRGKWIGVAGDPMGDAPLTSAFLALGIDVLALSVPNILPMRRRIMETTVGNRQEITAALEF